MATPIPFLPQRHELCQTMNQLADYGTSSCPASLSRY